MENQEQQHKRRVRYKGTHPRSYKEKYKELQPEKYADTIEKVIQKGGTPAGMHISICVQEILDFLQIQPGQIGLTHIRLWRTFLKDARLLRRQRAFICLGCRSYRDKKTKARLEKMDYKEDILTIKQMNFAHVDQLKEEAGGFDFVLADLGVSSMQIDNPERGFTYKFEGSFLDLRLNPEKGISAAERLKNISQPELEGMLIENSDEPYAKEISNTIISEIRRGNGITTTTQLQKAVEKALVRIPEKERKEMVKKSCARTFQALRIDVNSEFEVLEAFMEKLPTVLNKGARVAILTFHSGEDRLVKKAFQRFYREGVYSEISKDVIRPSAEECAKTAVPVLRRMRWAIA